MSGRFSLLAGLFLLIPAMLPDLSGPVAPTKVDAAQSTSLPFFQTDGSLQERFWQLTQTYWRPSALVPVEKPSEALILRTSDPNNPAPAITHNFPVWQQRDRTVTVRLYDTGERSTGTSVMLRSPNRNISTAVRLEQNGYQLSFTENGGAPKLIQPGFPRLNGWHEIAFVVTSFGTYVRLDDSPLVELSDAVGINQSFTAMGSLTLGRTPPNGDARSVGESVFATVDVAKNPAESFDSTRLFTSWTNSVGRLYEDTDFSEMVRDLGRDTRLGFTVSALASRALVAQALFVHWTRFLNTGSSAERQRAIELLEPALLNYQPSEDRHVRGLLLTFIAMLDSASFAELPASVNVEYRKRVVEYAEDLLDNLGEAQEEAAQSPDLVGGFGAMHFNSGEDVRNVEDVDCKTVGDGHFLCDTESDDLSPNTLMLVSAYLAAPDHPHAADWLAASKCYAFHSFSKGEVACGIRTRNVTDSGQVGNHGLYPYPAYAIAGILGLEQAKFLLWRAGKPIPPEFSHNIEAGPNSDVWRRNILECTEPNFLITERCHTGQDWGDRTIEMAFFPLVFWANLPEQRSGNRAEAQRQLDEMTAYFSATHLDGVWNPQVRPISRMPSDDVDLLRLEIPCAKSVYCTWSRNIENYAQLGFIDLMLRRANGRGS